MYAARKYKWYLLYKQEAFEKQKYTKWRIDKSKVHYDFYDHSTSKILSLYSQADDGWEFLTESVVYNESAYHKDHFLVASEKKEASKNMYKVDLFRYNKTSAKIEQIPLIRKVHLSEKQFRFASSPDGRSHAVANLDYVEIAQAEEVTLLKNAAVCVFEVQEGAQTEPKVKKCFQPGAPETKDMRNVKQIQWSRDGKFLSALFYGDSLMITWFAKSTQIIEIDKKKELGTNANQFEYLPVPERFKSETEYYFEVYDDNNKELKRRLGFKSEGEENKPQTRFYEYYKDQKKYEPPTWNHNSLTDFLPQTRIYCSAIDDLAEVRQCVVQRDLVNVKNKSIVRKPNFEMSGYQHLWDNKYSLSSNNPELGLPPNFALYTYAPIIDSSDMKNQDPTKVTITQGAPKRHVLHLIDYALDSENQPDHIYFSKLKEENMITEFKGFLRKTMAYVFACARDMNLREIVLPCVGRGLVKSFSLKNFKYLDIFGKVLQEVNHQGEFVIEFIGNGSEQGCFNSTETIPEAWFQTRSENKLFVNVWGPHSHAGNAHTADRKNSIDSWMGRCSVISYLSDAELNPSLADISSYRRIWGGWQLGKKWRGVTLRSMKRLTYGGMLFASEGSVVDFTGDAIVNAANNGCLDGGGVDGAVNNKGGDELKNAREALPIIEGTQGWRCKTGDAKLTIGGDLKATWCIHAVGPNYWEHQKEKGNELLKGAYSESMKIAKSKKFKSIAFALISAGIYRASQPLKDLFEIAFESILENSYNGLQEVHLVAYNEDELHELLSVFGSKQKT